MQDKSGSSWQREPSGHRGAGQDTHVWWASDEWEHHDDDDNDDNDDNGDKNNNY